MKRLWQLFGIFLALAWVPVTSHCVLEKIPGLEFLHCATDTPQNSDCHDDGCAQLETASYKVADTHTFIPAPLLVVLFQLPFVQPTIVEQPLPSTAAPSEISTGWQFSFRTALPPRAPSFVS